MKKSEDKYVIKGVGNYQICIRHPDSPRHYATIIPFNSIQQDNIIHSKNGRFLVLRNATLDIIDINRLFKKDEITADIYANHEILDVSIDTIYRASSRFKNAELRYIRLEQDCESFGEYKLVFKLPNIDLFYEKERIRINKQ